MTYWIVKIIDAQKFQDRINALLNEGWSLYGNTFSLTECGVAYFCQSLTKSK